MNGAAKEKKKQSCIILSDVRFNLIAKSCTRFYQTIIVFGLQSFDL